MTEPITITRSTESDSGQVWRLAALGLEDGQAIADPFHPTAELVEILRFQARQEVAA
jgi:hypothetical protein